MPSLFHKRDRSGSSNAMSEFGAQPYSSTAPNATIPRSRPQSASYGSSGSAGGTAKKTAGFNGSGARSPQMYPTTKPSSSSSPNMSSDNLRQSTSSVGLSQSGAGSRSNGDGSNGPTQTQPATAAMHNLRSAAELLNARKVYRAGYIMMLEPEANRFAKYYIRLEDCILCLWSDEGLKRALAEKRQLSPTSVNLIDGFVSIAEAKTAWAARCIQAGAATVFNFVLNTTGSSTLIFNCETEVELRQWVNTIRLALWERQRLETLYTGIRLGIKEEQQMQPVRSALSLSHSGARPGRAEGLMDVYLPGDTKWKRVYAVLTEPGMFREAARRQNRMSSASASPSTYNNSDRDGLPPVPNGPGSPPLGTASGKSKRKSMLSGLFGSRNDLAKEASSPTSAQGQHGAGSEAATASPVVSSYNQALEDPASGPTLALFGILSPLPPSAAAPTSPTPGSSVGTASSAGAGAPAAVSVPSSALKLTRRPVLLVSNVWSAYAVWPEAEAIVPHSKTFKLSGRISWNGQEIQSYSQSSSIPEPARANMRAIEECWKRQDRDGGRTGGEGQLLCLLVGPNAEQEIPPGPGHATKMAYRTDTGGELLSWILAFYDAFRLHGRPERLIYDQRNPISPYFAQPIGPARGGLYFETSLIEDLPAFTETRPRAISDQFSKMLFDRMNRLGALSPGARVPNYVLPGQYQSTQQHQRQASTSSLQQKQHLPAPPAMSRRDSSRSGGSSLPPTLPPIGESNSQPDLAGIATAGHSTSQAQARSGQLAQDHRRTASSATQQRELPPQPDESFSSSFDQALAQNEKRNQQLPGRSATQEASAYSSRPDSPSRAHPAILRPGSSDSSAHQHVRKPSLDAIHGNGGAPQRQRATQNDEDEEGLSRLGEAMYLNREPAPSQQPQNFHPGANVGTSSYPSSAPLSPVEGHYNAFPERSTPPPPSILSSTSANTTTRTVPSASAAVFAQVPGVPMPGQYVATPSFEVEPAVPGSSGDFVQSSRTGPDSDGSPSHQLAHAKPGLSLPGQTPQANLRPLSPPGGAQASFYTANTNAAGSSRAGSTAPSSLYNRDRDAAATPPPPVPVMPAGRQQEEPTLADEPAALYAMSLGNNDRPTQEEDADLHRSVSQTQPQRRNYPQTPYQRELASMIRERASGSAATKDQEPHSETNTTTANTPISALATSASEYSNTGTAFTPFRQFPEQGFPSGSAQSMASAPLPPSKDAAPLERNVSDGRQGEEASPSREPKVSSASTTEGQDDYLAAANFLALTADQEPPAPVPAPIPSPRQKPQISIQTGSKSPASSSVQPPSIVEQTPSTANSPEDPTSPDPYGTYTEAATSQRHNMHVVANSPPMRGKSGSSRGSASDRQQATVASAGSSSRKPGRRGAPMPSKSGKKLGSWSSDEDDEDNEQEKDSDADDSDAEDKQRGAISPPLQIHPPSENGQQRRQSIASSGGGSARRNLPELPGPSTDPYINQNASPSNANFRPGHQAHQSMQYPDDPQYAQYMMQQQQMRNSMYGWPGQQQQQGGMMQPWQQHQSMMMGGGAGYMPPYAQGQAGSGSGPNTPLAHSPSGSFSAQQAGMPPPQTNIISQIANQDGGAEGRAARNAAMAPHGLLQAALQDKQAKSAAAQEANAKETGGPFLQISAKPQGPQGGLVGAIAAHERDRKREGGLGATLTERERERRSAEQKQREMDQMHARNASFGGVPFGGPAFPGFGAMPNGMGGFGQQGGYNMDPAQMQQQMAMLAAQNAYLQAMAGFQNPGMMGGPGGFMSPPFSPQPGFGGPGSQAPYAQSMFGMGMGMQPPQPPYAGSNVGHQRRSSNTQSPHGQNQQGQNGQGGEGYFRQ